MPRPRSILYFELLLLGSLGVGVVQSVVGWAEATKLTSAGFALFVQIATFAILIGLTLLISRGRSRIAMWISIALFLFGLPTYFAIFLKGQLLGSKAISILQVIAQAVGYALLFAPSARAWLARRPAPAQLDAA